MAAVHRHCDRLTVAHGTGDARAARKAQLEAIGARIEVRADRRDRREALAIEHVPVVTDKAEEAIVRDAAAPELDVLARLYGEPFHRRNMEPRDLHYPSLPH